VNWLNRLRSKFIYNTATEALESLRLTPEVLTKILHDITPAQTRTAPDPTGGWSVIEVVSHLRDTEERVIARLRILRDEAEPVIAGFDQEALARAGNYGENDLQVTLAAFAALRATHLAELTALQPVQWERTGHHVTNGAVTILNHTLHSVWHDTIHLAQIIRQLP